MGEKKKKKKGGVVEGVYNKKEWNLFKEKKKKKAIGL
jgi:hypothetical protein